jgi:hypothetical protein
MEKTLGPDHPYVVSAINNLAKLHGSKRGRGGRGAAPACLVHRTATLPLIRGELVSPGRDYNTSKYRYDECQMK